MIALFIVGPPGVGKTTLVRKLMPKPYAFIGKPKWTLADGVCAAGHYTGGTFDGADTVPYNGVDAALEYWAADLRKRCPLTIFDGDRFSHQGPVDFLKRCGAKIVVVHVTASEGDLAARRALRGSKQNPQWMKGRATKAARFAEAHGGTEVTGTPAKVERAVREILKAAHKTR